MAYLPIMTGYTGFEYTSPKTTEAEARVVAAGYPWASTSILRQPGPLPRNGGHIYYDYLGIHAHSGDNTHLIVSGKITIRQHPVCTPPYTLLTLPSGLNKSRYVQLSLDTGACKELPIGPGEIYEGTTEEGGAQFVEGHRCLSPTTAARFMERKTIHWTEDGVPVSTRLQRQIIQTLDDGGFVFRWARGAPLVVEVPSTYDLPAATREKLAEWFKCEWESYDQPWQLHDRARKRLVDVEGLYAGPKAWFGSRSQRSGPSMLRPRPKWVPHSCQTSADVQGGLCFHVGERH